MIKMFEGRQKTQNFAEKKRSKLHGVQQALYRGKRHLWKKVLLRKL